MEFRPQDTFTDRYVLKELLGRGSFGEVWLAYDKLAGIDVALKIYIALDNRGLSDFRNEYRSVYNANHPNILTPTHYDVWNNQPYLVMHYCPVSGESLIGCLSENDIWTFISDVSSGLTYLHDQDIIHRDIKPDNILRDSQGRYVLTDFGLSKKLRASLRRNSTRSQQEDVSGALSYMGPELFESKPEAVKATDIWALGVTIYEMLVGELPFMGQGGVMQKNGADIPELPDTYSYGLRKLVHDCLQKNPWDRPTAAQLASYKGLKEPHPETQQQIINSRLVKGGIFGMAAILLVGLVIWWNGRHGEGDSRERSVTEIRLDRTSLILEEGDADTLLVTYIPSDATETITAWESGNNEVAIVDNSGKVTAKKAGTASITAVCNGHSATCTVTVIDPQQVCPPASASAAVAVTTGTSNGHEWVDLGLSVKWATCNVGASSPSDYGNYYAWGETSTKNHYSWKSYKFWMSGNKWQDLKFSKYNIDSSNGAIDDKTQLDYSDDAARVNWGESWRMPTETEWEELLTNCTWVWTNQNGKKGYRVSSKTNENSIFLPAAGMRDKESDNTLAVGVVGWYWSSSLLTDFPRFAWDLYFELGEDVLHYSERYCGNTVRPVTE